MYRLKPILETPKSPLTPIIPLSKNSLFDFNFGGDCSLKSDIKTTPKTRDIPHFKDNDFTTPRRMPPYNASRTIDLSLPALNFSDQYENVKQSDKQQQQRQQQEHMLEEPLIQQKQQQILEQQELQQRRQRSTFKRKFNEQQRPRQAVLRYRHEKQLFQQNKQMQQQKKQQHYSLSTPKHHQQHSHHLKQGLEKEHLIQHLQQDSNNNDAKSITLNDLSPRVGAVLRKSNLTRFMRIFQKEEIDLLVFCTLTHDDLKLLGITDDNDCNKILEAIKWAQNFYM